MCKVQKSDNVANPPDQTRETRVSKFLTGQKSVWLMLFGWLIPTEDSCYMEEENVRKLEATATATAHVLQSLNRPYIFLFIPIFFPHTTLELLFGTSTLSQVVNVHTIATATATAHCAQLI